MSAQAAEQAAAADDADFLYVEDPTALANNPDREHELAEFDPKINQTRILTFKFTAGEKKKLPMHQALKFLKAGFIVTDADGNSYDPTPIKPSNGTEIALAADQCIARYSELTQEALLFRVKQEFGGEVFNKAARKAELVDFLVSRDAKKLAAAARAESGGGEAAEQNARDRGQLTGGSMSAAEVDRMFADQMDG